MFAEMQHSQCLLRVDAQDLVGRLARIDGEQDCDQPTHDVSIAVPDEEEARGAAIGIDGRRKPDLADAALHLVDCIPHVVGKGLQLPAELDDIAVAILPVVEKLEILTDVLETGRV